MLADTWLIKYDSTNKPSVVEKIYVGERILAEAIADSMEAQQVGMKPTYTVKVQSPSGELKNREVDDMWPALWTKKR